MGPTISSYPRDDATDSVEENSLDEDLNWTSDEEKELIKTIIGTLDWDAVADVLQEKDIDKTAEECMDRFSVVLAKLATLTTKDGDVEQL